MIAYAIVVQTLAVAALAAFAAAGLLLAGVAAPAGRLWIRQALGGRERHPIAWAWAVAALATAGSLYFSEVVGFVPCLLCWYQRIAMYPLVLVLGVGLLRADPAVWRFALPLPLVGAAISAYHVMVQFQPTLEIGTCGAGPPCSGRYIQIFGFVTIPVMAGAAFVLVAALLLVLRSLRDGGPSEDFEG